MLNKQEKKRLCKILVVLAVLLLLGVAYAVIYSLIGKGIPCVFNEITGFKCPGCGISRMFMSLFKGDIKAAWSYNPAVLCIILPSVAVAVDMATRYVKTGSKTLHRWANILVYAMIAVLLVYGVFRNIKK